MVLKNLISHKLTSKKQNLCKNSKHVWKFFKKKKKEEKWGRLNILIPQTESFILGKL